MAVNRDLLTEVEQFLYREAQLLDEGRFHEWLELFTEDVSYWMPIRESVLGETEAIVSQGPKNLTEAVPELADHDATAGV